MRAFAALLGRVLLAGLFLFTGYQKVLNPSGVIREMTAAGIPFPKILYAGTLALELLGGVLLFLGARTRATALVFAAFVAVATFYYHLDFHHGGQTVELFKNAAVVGGLLCLFAFGPGRLSLDGD